MAYLLWHYVSETARQFPARCAVKHQDVELSYRELDALSDRISTSLTARGIGRGDRVALYMPKSWQSVVAMLGVSKAGATYVPIDPNAPGERALYILQDCAVSCVFVADRCLDRIASGVGDTASLVLLVRVSGDADPADENKMPEEISWDEITRGVDDADSAEPGIEYDPAFLLYTSGSTGFPKGVIISHRNAMTFVDWGAKRFNVTPDDRLSNHAPLHFDLSVFDIYTALKCGATVVLVPDKTTLFASELTSWIRDEKITIWYSVPSALTRLLLHGGLAGSTFPDLRTVLYAGEPFPVKYLREVMAAISGARFFNLYGPTETNVCTYHALPAVLPQDLTDVPIGRPCENTCAFAADENGKLIAQNESGELFVRGPSVMLGYWGKPERTQNAFSQNPLHDDYPDPVYATGDIVRLEADGAYTFVSRKDHMVKSRGYRIELGEVEHALYANDKVREAAVIAIADEEIGARLYAAVSLHDDTQLTEGELKSFCRQKIPNYMVPEDIKFHPKLPETSTGKIDRVAVSKMFNEKES